MPKGKVRIVSGATSRRKVLEIEGATATAIAAAFPDLRIQTEIFTSLN
jgi:uncharacterized protein YggU (UPF0235/DUF167 family)